jgi:hypothetical protein
VQHPPRIIPGIGVLDNRVACGLISARTAPDHNGIMRPASSDASAPLLQPAARIVAALRSSSCAIMCRPPGNAVLDRVNAIEALARKLQTALIYQ